MGSMGSAGVEEGELQLVEVFAAEGGEAAVIQDGALVLEYEALKFRELDVGDPELSRRGPGFLDGEIDGHDLDGRGEPVIPGASAAEPVTPLLRVLHSVDGDVAPAHAAEVPDDVLRPAGWVEGEIHLKECVVVHRLDRRLTVPGDGVEAVGEHRSTAESSRFVRKDLGF